MARLIFVYSNFEKMFDNFQSLKIFLIMMVIMITSFTTVTANTGTEYDQSVVRPDDMLGWFICLGTILFIMCV